MVAVTHARAGMRFVNQMFKKTQIKSIARMAERISSQTGVADGGGDLTLTAAKVGDIIYDVDNDDWFICTVAATTVTQISP